MDTCDNCGKDGVWCEECYECEMDVCPDCMGEDFCLDCESTQED